jgi:hypothetical protein
LHFQKYQFGYVCFGGPRKGKCWAYGYLKGYVDICGAFFRL